jgi:hypothetical protein
MDDLNDAIAGTSDPASSSTKATTAATLRSEMLCMIAIPASLTCNELLDFVMPYS